MSDYVEIMGAIDAADEESLADALFGERVLGATLEPEGPGSTRVSVWVASGQEAAVDRVSELLGRLGTVPVRLQDHAAADWSAAWRKDLSAFPVGRRWWIDPHPEQPSLPPNGRIRLEVEPRDAFGSGTHESTRLVLVELEERGCCALDVLDLGTGSGVLAVAAAALGAGSVVAVDIDPMAAWEARRTAARQAGGGQPKVVAGSVRCLDRTSFDLVLCNMTVTEFEPLLPDLFRLLAPGGSAVLSGVLATEREEVEILLGAHGFSIERVRGLGEWISVVVRRPLEVR